MEGLGALAVFKKDIDNYLFRLREVTGCNNDRILLFVDASKNILLEQLFSLSKCTLFTELNAGNEVGNPEYIKSKYTELEQQVITCCEQWLVHFSEIWNSLEKDKLDISRCFFGGGDVGIPVDVNCHGADRHRGGRTTVIVTFSCGNKIVYKPRNLNIEKSFYSFLSQLNAGRFYEPKFIVKDKYGWMEFIPFKACDSVEQVEAFYSRSGTLLSVLYALQASDIHSDNLIAYGSEPIIVDLEMLFHRDFDALNIDSSNFSDIRPLFHSVLKSYLLPLQPSSEFSISAISHISAVQKNIEHNMPVLKGEKVPVTEFIDAFIKGFTLGYKQIITLRDVSDIPSKILSSFANYEARYVCRKTAAYQRLFKAFYHPDFQSGKKTRDLIFTAMYKNCTSLEAQRVDLECKALSKGDVPRFSHYIKETDLILDGEGGVKNYFKISAFDEVSGHISSMNDNDLQQQIKIINQSLRYKHIGLVDSFDSGTEEPDEAIFSIIDREFLDFNTIGCWPVYSNQPYYGYSLNFSNHSLYDGQLGINFFAAHALLAGNTSSGLSLSKVVRNITAIRGLLLFSAQTIGFSGFAGYIYINATILNKTLFKSQILSNIKLAVESIEKRVEYESSIDVVDGLSGAILILLSAEKIVKEAWLSRVLDDCLNKLLVVLNQYSDGKWLTFRDKTLCGFAHGLSGIGHALVRYGVQKTHHEAYQKGLELLEFESKQYNEVIGNWPDFRISENTNAMSAWCHGAVGIGLSRLSCKKYLGSDAPAFFEKDIMRAKSNLEKTKLVKKHGLCHGNLGNLELVRGLYEGGYYSENTWQSVRQKSQRYVSRLLRHSAQTSDKHRVLTLNFMNGWAGIGYQLMRHNNNDLPNLLMLEI